MVAEHLATLHSALIDARAGYKKALEKADDLSVLSQLRAADGLHAAAHADVHRILLSRGAEFDENGSCIGRMHKAAISMRAAIGGLQEGSLASFASDEEHNIHVYDAAIREEGDNAARTTLVRHREALAAEAVQMKRIAASA